MRLLWIIILFFSLILSACSSDQSRVPANVVNIPNSASGDMDQNSLPVIEFATLDHDFGKVIQGEIVSYSFKFKNTGKSDLVIGNISTSCGCTASEYPKTPIKPGQEEVIEVSFDSSGREGFQHKTLEVATNTQPSVTVLSIKAMVFSPEKQ
jgi:hypothetical protein